MVYVDNMEAKFGRMVMCHMIADTTEELLEMADKIGVQRKWIQYPGTYNEHFDVSKGARQMAIFYGAQQISMMELGRMLAKRPGSPFYKQKQ